MQEAALPVLAGSRSYAGRVPRHDDLDPPLDWEATQFPDSPDTASLPAILPRLASETQVVRELARRFPRYGAPDVRGVQFAETYAHLMAVSAARAEWLGLLLQDQLERYGLEALVSTTYATTRTGEVVEVGKEVSVIAKLEAEERKTAERLARDGIRIGIEASQVDSMRSYGKTVVTAMRALVKELGIDWNDPAVTRVSRRALLQARHELGFDVRPPDEAGPALSLAERERVLGTGE